MIHLAVENSPIDAAWAAFDAAAIRLNRMYAECSPDWDTPAEVEARRQLSIEVVRLWSAFQALFLGDDPGAAA